MKCVNGEIKLHFDDVSIVHGNRSNTHYNSRTLSWIVSNRELYNDLD